MKRGFNNVIYYKDFIVHTLLNISNLLFIHWVRIHEYVKYMNRLSKFKVNISTDVWYLLVCINIWLIISLLCPEHLIMWTWNESMWIIMFITKLISHSLTSYYLDVKYVNWSCIRNATPSITDLCYDYQDETVGRITI